MKRLFTLALVGVLSTALFGCGKGQTTTDNNDKKNIVLGATLKPAGEIIEFIKPDFEAKGYTLEIKLFDDYVIPNTALEEGSIDGNLFQHEPYLIKFNEEHGTNLVSVKKLYLPPLGGYSKKIKSLDELSDGATITVPNDATNESRALRILQDNGLIKVADKDLLTKADITENPKNLEIMEVDSAQLPRTLDDVDVAVINASFALPAGLDPKNDTLFSEKADSPYANVFAVKKGNEDAQWVKDFIEVITSEKTKKFIDEEYKGSILPVF